MTPHDEHAVRHPRARWAAIAITVLPSIVAACTPKPSGGPAPSASASAPVVRIAPSASSASPPAPAPVAPVDPSTLPDVVGAPGRWPDGYEPPLERARAAVRVAGADESWVLRWRSPPEPACFTKEGRATARCIGFTGGAERGQLELVRERGGVEVSAFDLGEVLGEGGRVVLPRYASDVRFSARGLAGAPVVPIMKVSDVNQDGTAAELVLPGRHRPWGERAAYMVGFAPGDGKPFAFHAAKAATWEAVRALVDPLEIITLPCLDHASPTEHVELFVKMPGGVTRETREYPCTVVGSKVVRAKPKPGEPPVRLGW